MQTVKTEIIIDSDICELVPRFSEARRKELTILNASVAKEDFVTIAKISHTVKGIARPYGFPALEALFVRLEHAAKASDTATCKNILQDIEKYCNAYSF